MEEVIESLVAIIKDKTKDFTYLDQEQMFRDLSGRLNDMSLDAMKCEYLGERRSHVKTTGERVQWQDIPLLRQCANTGDGRLDPWHGCKRERGTPVFYDLQRCRP